MLDDGLVITAVNVQSDNRIQRNAYSQEFEHLIQESTVEVTRNQL